MVITQSQAADLDIGEKLIPGRARSASMPRRELIEEAAASA